MKKTKAKEWVEVTEIWTHHNGVADKFVALLVNGYPYKLVDGYVAETRCLQGEEIRQIAKKLNLL